jgi:WD40 repeat protein
VLSPGDNKQLMSGSLDGTVKLWDVTTQQCTYTFNHGSAVYSLTRLEGSKWASGGNSGEIKVLDPALYGENTTAQVLKDSGTIYSLAYLHPHMLFAQSSMGTIKHWNVESSQVVRSTPNVSKYVSTVVTFSDRYIVSEKSTYKIGVWDVETGDEVFELEGHKQDASSDKNRNHIRAFANCSDRVLASGSTNFDIKIWDTVSRKSVLQLVGHQNYVNGLVGFDGHYLLSTSGDQTIKLWDARYNKGCVETKQTDHDSWIQAIALSEDCSDIYSGSGDHTIGVWPLINHSLSSTARMVGSTSAESASSNHTSHTASTPETKPTPRYFFDVEDGILVFHLQMDLDQSDQSQLFLNIIEVTQLKEVADLSLDMDFTKGKLRLKFKNFKNDTESVKKLHSFLDKLSKLGISETHQNRDAMWFYAANGGNEILNVRNYPQTLLTFLEKERAAFLKGISQAKAERGYNVLVEVGCGELENIKIAQDTQLKYAGVEFSPGAAAAANRKISRNRIENATVQCVDILDLKPEDLAFNGEDRPIFIFPFNLLGNIAPISLLFSKLLYLGYDFMVSIYKTDSPTNTMRLAYYQNCGYKSIAMNEDDKGNIIFSSDEGLYTVAYSQRYLAKLLSAMGFKVSTSESSEYGLMLYAQSLCKPKQALTQQASQASEQAALLAPQGVGLSRDSSRTASVFLANTTFSPGRPPATRTSPEEETASQSNTGAQSPPQSPHRISYV